MEWGGGEVEVEGKLSWGKGGDSREKTKGGIEFECRQRLNVIEGRCTFSLDMRRKWGQRHWEKVEGGGCLQFAFRYLISEVKGEGKLQGFATVLPYSNKKF